MAQAAPTRPPDVMCLEILAFCEAVLPDSLRSKATQRPSGPRCSAKLLPRLCGTAALSMAMGQCRLSVRMLCRNTTFAGMATLNSWEAPFGSGHNGRMGLGVTKH